MNTVSKKIICFIASLIFVCGVSLGAAASEPYGTYDYSTDNYNDQISSAKSQANARRVPDAFSYETALNSDNVTGLDKPLNAPEDFVYDKSGRVIISDTGNARLVLIDINTLSAREIIGWRKDSTSGNFAGAVGLFFGNGRLYVCLRDEGRVLIIPESAYLNTAGSTVVAESLIEAPDLSSVTDSFSFKPSKVVADDTMRMYVIVQGTFDGLVTLDADGEFLGYMGANEISMSLWERFWRSIYSEKQINASADTVPVEFYGMDIDGEGFIYTTSKGENSENAVRRLNLIGRDVIKNSTHYIKGDLSVLTKKGNPGTDSNLVDIDVTDGGIYTCLDNARGRIFTYNSDGDLLFAFGGLAARKGAFSVPCAVEWCEEKLAVLDKGAGELVIFAPTEYGSAVIEAAVTQYSGEYGESWSAWEKVLAMNPNNETANRNVGKLEYDKGDYKSAMRYFKTANDTELYSKAYSKYRSEKMSDIIPYIAVAIILLAVFLTVATIVRYIKASRERFKNFIKEVRRTK